MAILGTIFGSLGMLLSAISIRFGWIIILAAGIIDLINGAGVGAALWTCTWTFFVLVVCAILGFIFSAIVTAISADNL
jgi:hypothetical protein